MSENKNMFKNTFIGVASLFSEIEYEDTPVSSVDQTQTQTQTQTTPQLSTTELFDTNIAIALEQTLREATQGSFSYINFKDTISKMKDSIPNEEQRFKAAFAAAEVMGNVSKQKLVNSAKKSLEVVIEEKNTFFNDVKQSL